MGDGRQPPGAYGGVQAGRRGLEQRQPVGQPLGLCEPELQRLSVGVADSVSLAESERERQRVGQSVGVGVAEFKRERVAESECVPIAVVVGVCVPVAVAWG